MEESAVPHAQTQDRAPERRLVPLALLLLLAAAFVPALLDLARAWDAADYMSHGSLIPVVALWAAWRESPARTRLPVRSDARGGLVLGAALLLYLGGVVTGSVTLEGLAVVAAVAGMAWWQLGLARLRALAFPIGFLLFMVPIPQPWIAPAIVSLRLLVTQAAVAVLQTGGAPVTREGNVIWLPGGESLFVAEACSGVTSLVTLTPLAVLLAAFTERLFWRRALLVAAVVPIALLGNLARVVGTVLAARAFGVERVTEASLHESAGLVAYLLGCFALLAVASLLRRVLPASPA